MLGSLRLTWDVVKRLWDTDLPPEGLDGALAELRAKQPAPVFWLFGKTQSGKTSLIRQLTGAEDAAIGSGFRPCTRTSREYPFPAAEAPLLTFLDTRGVDEPGYDPAADITAFAGRAHLMVVTVKITDFAQATVTAALGKAKRAAPERPVILALTCLHEADPLTGHEQPYPYADLSGGRSEPLRRLIAKHQEHFGPLVDAIVPIDFTKPEEGFPDTGYGAEHLRDTLLRLLPEAYRQSLLRTKDATDALKDLHQAHAGPLIVAYASLAATAGTIPIPFVDLLILPGIQSRMVFHLAKVYGQELTAVRFLELAGSLGLGFLARQAVREVAKLIPFVGSAAGAAVAWASTYALGRAFCLYYEEVHAGHVPDAADLKRFYAEQFDAAKLRWSR